MIHTKKSWQQHLKKVRDEYIKELIKDKAITSIYQFGEQEKPGKSDIDLIITIKDGETLKKETVKLLNNAKFPLDKPIVVPENIRPYAEGIRLKDYNNLKEVYKRKWKKKNINKVVSAISNTGLHLNIKALQYAIISSVVKQHHKVWLESQGLKYGQITNYGTQNNVGIIRKIKNTIRRIRKRNP